ncbi:MAG: His/Gly/Thr/Pro-type tRNA ligase C-terminal domain-containing protein, partial [Nanoarchaeota archaeon]
TWQCATIQLDFAMPERFGLKYTDENNKVKMPAMVHRTVLGSLERFIGVLLEHTSGNLPVWLSPIQVRVLSFTDRNIKATEKIEKEMREAGVRVDSDLKDETVNNKVRNAEIQHIPYIIVIGDKEEKSKTLAVRKHGKVYNIKTEKFIKELKEEIEKRE